MDCPALVSVTANGGSIPSASLAFSRILSLEATFAASISVLPGAFFLSTATFSPYSITDQPSGGIIVSVAGAVATLTFDPTVAGVEYNSLADGNWTLSIDKTKINSLISVTDIRRLFGDLNGDGTVDGTDFTLFGAAYGSSTGDPNYDAQADFNGDGVIDLTDYGEFGNRFGMSV